MRSRTTQFSDLNSNLNDDERAKLEGCLDNVLVDLIDHPLLSDKEILEFEQAIRSAPNMDYILTWWGDPLRAIALLKLLKAFCGNRRDEHQFSAADATETFSQSGRDEQPAIVCAGDVLVDGDLDLLAPVSLFIVGSLKVAGNYTDSSAAHVFVGGDMHAFSVATEGDLVVAGGLIADTVVHAYRNDGTLAVCGETTAKLVLSEDHLTIVGGAPGTHVVSTEDQDFDSALRALVVNDFISNEGQVDVAAVVAACRSGLDVFRLANSDAWEHPRGLPAELASVGERLARVIEVEGQLLMTSIGEYGNAFEGRVWRRDTSEVWMEVKGKGQSFAALLLHSSGDVLIGGRDGVIERSSDLGSTWSRVPTPTSLKVKAIAEGPDGVLYVAGEKGLVMRSVDDGANWTPLKPEVTGVFRRPLQADVTDICTHGGVVLICTVQGQILRSIDRGESWSGVDSGVTVPLARFVSRESGFVVVVGARGTVLMSQDGAEWERKRARTEDDIEDVIEVDGRQLCAVTRGGTLLCSADAVDWEQHDVAQPNHLFSLCAASDGTLVCVGSNGTFACVSRPSA